MKKLIYLFILTFFITGFKESYSQNPTYELAARNFEFTNGCGHWNSVEFDIYMRNTGSVPLEYAMGQYFINFDPSIANGGTLTYEIVGSDLPSNMLPVNPSIGTVPESPGGVLRMAGNLPSPGFFISSSFPGTKIVRMRLRTTASEFVENLNPGFAWRNPPLSFYTSIFAYVNGFIANITNSSNHSVWTNGSLICNGETIPWCSCRFTHAISINSIIEGLYNPQINRLNRKDTLTIELRKQLPPYDLFMSQKTTLDSLNFSSYITFSTFLVYDPGYYIAIKHFNSIETWTKMPSLYGSLLNYYNFIDSAQSAFGNNLKLVGTKYTMYSGDVNQDGVIDVQDFATIDNDTYNFTTGRFIPSDLNGDNHVDALDMTIADNNNIYISVIRP